VARTAETLAFKPTIRFTVPAGIWRPGLDLDQQLFLRAELPGMPADEIDAMPIVRLVNVFVEPCTQGEAAARPWDEPPGGEAFMRWLGQQTDVDLGPVGTLTAFGRPAQQVVATLPLDAFSDCAEGFLPIGEVFGGPSGIIALPRQGQRFRLTAFDLAGSTYLFLTFGAPERWDELVVATDQLVGTLEFEVGSTP